MSPDTENIHEQLSILARHLSEVHENILDAWLELTKHDALLASFSHLTREQFINDIPHIIHAFCRRLRTWPEDDTREQRQMEIKAVKLHSRNRWELGYNMRTLVRDLGHLNVCLLKVLDSYGRGNPELQGFVLPEARQLWGKLINDSIAQSAVEYHDLLQVEAAARLNHLKTVLEHMHEMEMVRGNDLRAKTHDLRGNLGMLMFIADEVGNKALSQTERAAISNTLNRGIATLHQMLEELMDMARLEAAQDPRHIARFDVGQVFNELCLASQPLAAARGLSLKADGPVNFIVEGDLVKTRRITQNLLLNALKYTNKGGVSVTWKAHAGDQLLLCVQDTGPGLEHDLAGGPGQAQGEGVGLSIVKRLCELLDAKIQVESKAGVGTTFQIIFPLHYIDKNNCA